MIDLSTELKTNRVASGYCNKLLKILPNDCENVIYSCIYTSLDTLTTNVCFDATSYSITDLIDNMAWLLFRKNI